MFTITTPHHVYATTANVTNVLLALTEALLLGLGLTMLLGAGIFDLSLGANLVLSSVIGAKVMLLFGPGTSTGLAIAAGAAACLGGAPGIPPLQSRTLPFVKAVETSRPDLKALPTEYSGFDVNKVTTDLGSILLANPDLKLVITADGPDAQGAVSAIKAAGKAGQVTLVAFDAIPTEVAALKEGVITGLIAQSPFQIGRDSIKGRGSPRPPSGRATGSRSTRP